MNTYKTTNVIKVHSGLIGLSKEQAKVRMLRIKPMKDKDGLYDITDGPLSFKVGEVIQIAEPDKNTLMSLELLKGAKPKAKSPASKKIVMPKPSVKKKATDENI